MFLIIHVHIHLQKNVLYLYPTLLLDSGGM